LHGAKIRAHDGPLAAPLTDRSDDDDVERHACPKCEAQPGSSCRYCFSLLRAARMLRPEAEPASVPPDGQVNCLAVLATKPTT
jgi:hypothetical protein